MFKRILTLIGTVTFSLVALSSLVWLMASSVSVVRADPACVQITSDIMTHTTWTGECYQVMTTTVTVQPGVVLTISPPITGTRVEFMSGSQLQVFGYFYALGTYNRPITFTTFNTNTPGTWLGIIFMPLSTTIGIPDSTIQHSVIEYAHTGIQINSVKYLRILSNTFRYNGTAGSTDGAIVGITDYSTISNNRISSSINGILLNKSYENSIISNAISGASNYGVALVEPSGLPGGSSNDIIGNEIYGCGSEGIRLQNGDGNWIISNSIYLNAGNGVYLSSQSRDLGTNRYPLVALNSIYSNTGGGLQLATDLLAKVLSNTIYNTAGDAINLSGQFDLVTKFNALCAAPPSYRLRNNDTFTTEAPANWWGTNTPTASQEYTGPVSLNPWITLTLGTWAAELPADGASSTVVTIALRDSEGFTVPPPPTRQTNPPAPNPRRIELTTTLGALSPILVSVDDHGIATTTLTSASTPGTATLTARAFCGFAYTTTVKMIGADLAVTKSDSPDPVTAGQALTYTLAFTNAGPSDAQNVFITDTLPVSVIYRGVVSETPPIAGPTQTGRLLTWYTPTLAAGASGSIVFTATVDVNALGTMTNSVVITGSTPDPAFGNNRADESTTVVAAAPDLVVLKDDDVGPTGLRGASLSLDEQAAVDRALQMARPLGLAQHREFVYGGDWVTYTIAVINHGTYTATNVVLTETLPAHTSFVTGTGWIAVTPVTYTLFVGTLTPDEGQVYYFVVRVDNQVDESVTSLFNQVCGWGRETDVNPNDNCGEEDTPIRHKPVRVTKSSSQCIAPGAEFDYFVTYSNITTGTTFYNVLITDTLPFSVTYQSGPGWNCVGNVCTRTVSPLSPTVTGTFSLPVRLDSNFSYTIARSITNTVEISGGNPFILATSIDTGFDLTVVKNDNVGSLPLGQQQVWDQVERRLFGFNWLSQAQNGREYVQPGERITYTILYVNKDTSTNTARNVILTETLPANTQYIGGGWTHAGGNFYTISLGDLEPGHGGELHFIVEISKTLPCGTGRIVNRVRISSSNPECDLSNNWSSDETPVLSCIPSKVFLPIILREYPPVVPDVAFSSSNYAAWEDDGAVTLTVVLNDKSSQTVTVKYATSDGTAIAGSGDYITRTGTLTFAPGVTEQTFTVTILNDAVYEPNETVTLTLSDPVNAELGAPNPATLTILNVGCKPTPPGCAPDVWCTFHSRYSPMGMAYDSGKDYLFVANQSGVSNDGNLTIISATSGLPLRVVPDLSGAQGVALDKTRGRNRIYVVGGNSLYVVDGATYGISTTIGVGVGDDVGAYAVAHEPTNDLIYVTGFRDNSVTIIDATTWLTRTLTGFQSPSYIAVNTTTHKVYVSNHTGGPVSWVTVISETAKINKVWLSGDVYGITADSIHNRVYVASISAARVYAIDGDSDVTLGDIQIIRSRDGRPVPLRMVAVNPKAGSDTHLWLTSSDNDFWGMDRLILLPVPGSNWPPAQSQLQPLAVEVMSSPEGGLVFDPDSWKVFASSAASDLVTVSKDNTNLCTTAPLRLGAGADELFGIVHEYERP